MGNLTALKDFTMLRPPVEAEPEPWVCSTCGPTPYLLLPTGRYIRRSCACTRKAKHEQEKAQERAEKLEAMARYTYGGWLGKEWFDPNYCKEWSTKTFDQYDLERKQEFLAVKQRWNRESDPARKAMLEKEVEQFEVNRKYWRNAKERSIAFAKDPQGTLLFYGTCGLGKTHLLASICNALRERGISSLFVVTPVFFSAFYDRMEHSENDEWQIVKQAMHTPFLVIDDLDKASPKPFRQDIFFQIIDSRIMAKRPIGISTNNMEGLAAYVGDAAYSRLMDGCTPIYVSGRDYRKNFVVR